MKHLLLCLLLCPLLSAAQYINPRFENDTLYTSCGYKIYPGQTLQFGKATNPKGFRYISIKNGVALSSLENNSIVVKELSHYDVSIFGFTYIDITGSIVYRDGSNGSIIIRMAFDKAIGTRLPGTISELILPEEFRITIEKAAALNMPGFREDTLYTSCGFKIYKGQLLQFGKTTGNRGNFRYVNIRSHTPPEMLQNNSIRVKELKEFGISALGNGYITITGTLVVNNNERGDIEIHMAFDHAIENLPGVPSELIVPDEFRNKLKIDAPAEIERLNKLYQNGTISLEEFEALKKKLEKQ
jgi:hypothetical protein